MMFVIFAHNHIQATVNVSFPMLAEFFEYFASLWANIFKLVSSLSEKAFPFKQIDQTAVWVHATIPRDLDLNTFKRLAVTCLHDLTRCTNAMNLTGFVTVSIFFQLELTHCDNDAGCIHHTATT